MSLSLVCLWRLVMFWLAGGGEWCCQL